MKTKTKALLITMCAALLVIATVFTTLVFLTDDKSVVNSFTVGNVKITLDETDVTTYGVKDTDTRVVENDYHLVPNHEYIKDPTVHVQANREECYVRMFVTMNQITEWDEVLAPYKKDDSTQYTTQDILTTLSDKWTLHATIEGTDANGAGVGTRTYEFWYSTTVTKSDEVTNLDAPFGTIKMPKDLTNADLAKIDGESNNFKIYAVAQAIQADGFENATAAFTAAPAITGSDLTP